MNAEFLHYLLTLLVVGNIRTQSPSSHSFFRYYFTRSLGVYKRLGQFDYGQPNCTTDHIKTCIGYEWIYIGGVKEGTDDTEHGIGIRVDRLGDITEGYWKDGQLHGRGRTIYYDGECYTGEFKEGRYNGEGTLYYDNGDKYEGGLKRDDHYGQGTYYTKDGDKYTGIWDDWEGQGEVNYKDGKKYKGYWDVDRNDNWKLKRHGVGTLYSADGQVINQGKWEWDEYKGKK